jgi:tetratricopeptide (TPR) repeat protein
MGQMQKAGVKILAGSDYTNPGTYAGFSLHDELQLLVEGGLTPAQALKTATVNPAAYLRKEADYGRIAPGQYASLVLLDANPLASIGNTRKIAGVFLKGHYFAQPELAQLLVQAQKNAARIPVSGWFMRNLKSQGLAKAQARLDSLVQQKPDTYDYSENVLVSLGYQLLAGKQLKPALAIFQLSTALYPTSSNTYDSYAEALAADGQKALAIQNYEKSLALDPTNTNAVDMVRKLRATK